MWELTARGAQEGDAPRPRARRGVGARERSRKRSPFEVKTREESCRVKLFLREEEWKSLEKIRSYFILLHLWSRFHRSPAILLEVRLLVWTIGYEKSRRVWNRSCGCMRASTVRCRFLDRCGDRLGVESSFKDICILAAVLNSRCRK